MEPYEVLGVPKDADEETLKKARREKIKKAHPDRGGSHELTVEINTAFDVLNDPKRREHYDKTGQTGKVPSLEEKAKSVLQTSYSSCIEKCLEEVRPTNPFKELVAHFKQVVPRCEKEIKRLEKVTTRLLKHKEKLGAGCPKDSMFMVVLESKQAAIFSAISGNEEQLAVAKKCLEMLEAYKKVQDVEGEEIEEESSADAFFRTLASGKWRAT